jgi:hypothetical protein
MSPIVLGGGRGGGCIRRNAGFFLLHCSYSIHNVVVDKKCSSSVFSLLLRFSFITYFAIFSLPISQFFTVSLFPVTFVSIIF